MEKIIITGGLGYIGTELCKIYSGESRFKNITVIDSRFVSERVKQLRDWGINFIQSSILNEDILKKHLKDADVVIHLAGITDVAYVKSESSEAEDERIREVGVTGTRNIIKYTGDQCKILFPSTHVVFEGLEETKTNIVESEEPLPVLPYSRGKIQSEDDLKKSGKNYIILRLASVYGYSTDTMRLNIMPNLFSRIASQNGTLKLFSAGVQLKSLVPLIDVARCFKYMAENEDINREIFHCSKESMTVKEVAQLCKEFNPRLELIDTDDEIPNLGYTISNEKLLSTGFKFLYNIRDSIGEMITNWSAKKINPELEFLDKGGKELVDSRGRINNYELTEPINMIGYIESKRGTVRANHYHPIQEQKCLLVKGQYISVLRDLSDPQAQLITQVVNAGDLSVIKPNVAHTMVFTQDSIFLNLVRGEREHENYGITHTIRHVLVDDKMRDDLLENYRTDCRSCGSIQLKRVLSLGESPLANSLTNTSEEKSEVYPLEMNYCTECHNCQLSYTVPAERMFDNYLYVSSTSKTFRQHFEKAAAKYVKKFKLNQDSKVLDIGSNDGVALKPLSKYAVNVLGIEPAVNVSRIANEGGVSTINDYFTTAAAAKIEKAYGKMDLITASNVFAHADDLRGIIDNVFKLLKSDGTFVIEVQYLLNTISDLTFDNIYHEHVNYWCVTSLAHFFNSLGYHIVEVEHVETHGGSIRVYVQKYPKRIEPSVNKFLKAEKSFGLLEYETYQDFANKVSDIKSNVNANFEKLKSEFNVIAGYGSPAKATTSLNYFGVGTAYVDYIIEDNPLKNGKYIPGVKLPIKDKEYCYKNLPDLVVVMAWNFFDYIKKNNQNLIKKGITFVNIKDLQDENFRINSAKTKETKETNETNERNYNRRRRVHREPHSR